MIRIILQIPYAMMLGWEILSYEDGKAYVIHLLLVSIEYSTYEDELLDE